MKEYFYSFIFHLQPLQIPFKEILQIDQHFYKYNTNGRWNQSIWEVSLFRGLFRRGPKNLKEDLFEWGLKRDSLLDSKESRMYKILM